MSIRKLCAVQTASEYFLALIEIDAAGARKALDMMDLFTRSKETFPDLRDLRFSDWNVEVFHNVYSDSFDGDLRELLSDLEDSQINAVDIAEGQIPRLTALLEAVRLGSSTLTVDDKAIFWELWPKHGSESIEAPGGSFRIDRALLESILQ